MAFRLWIVGAAALVLAASPAAAREWRITMVNSGTNGTMDFSPSFLRIASGDTVRFVAQDKGHNAESIAELTPPGAAPFTGKMNSDLVVKFVKPGLYGYKCLPHFAMGMVGLIEVGKPVNLPAFKVALANLPPLAKARMMKFVQQSR